MARLRSTLRSRLVIYAAVFLAVGFLVTLPSTTFAQNKCAFIFDGLGDFTKSPKFSEIGLENPDQFVSWLSHTAKLKTGQDHTWLDQLKNDRDMGDVVASFVRSTKKKSGTNFSKIRRLTAMIYRLRLTEVASRLGQDGREWTRTLKEIPDDVLLRRLEQGLLTEGIIQGFAEAGLPVTTRPVFEFLHRHENMVNLTVASLLTIPTLLVGDVSGLILPSIRLVKEKTLAENYGQKIQEIGYLNVRKKLRQEFGSTVQYEMIYSAIRFATNTFSMLSWAYAMLQVIKDKYETWKERDEKIEGLIRWLDNLVETYQGKSPDEAASGLLAEFEEFQKAKGGVPMTDEQRQLVRSTFQEVFEK